MNIRCALTIAGSDPSGGAGIQADLKTFHQFGVYGEAAITLLTVQNTRRVSRVELVDPALVAEQIRAVLEDIPPSAIKTGALGSAEIIAAVAETLRSTAPTTPLVLDPVMISKHGSPLIAAEAVDALRRQLLPMAALVTPNLPEAEALCGFPVRMLEQACSAARHILTTLGPRAVLVKGGHLADTATDVLITADDPSHQHLFAAARVATPHTHGTGCTYSAAIAAGLAQGKPLPIAVGEAKQFIARAIATNPGLGHGNGPVNHWASPVE